MAVAYDFRSAVAALPDSVRYRDHAAGPDAFDCWQFVLHVLSAAGVDTSALESVDYEASEAKNPRTIERLDAVLSPLFERRDRDLALGGSYLDGDVVAFRLVPRWQLGVVVDGRVWGVGHDGLFHKPAWRVLPLAKRLYRLKPTANLADETTV